MGADSTVEMLLSPALLEGLVLISESPGKPADLLEARDPSNSCGDGAECSHPIGELGSVSTLR